MDATVGRFIGCRAANAARSPSNEGRHCFSGHLRILSLLLQFCGSRGRAGRTALGSLPLFEKLSTTNRQLRSLALGSSAKNDLTLVVAGEKFGRGTRN